MGGNSHYLDTLCGGYMDPLPADAWLADSHFATCAFPFGRDRNESNAEAVAALVAQLTTADSLRALARPLQHEVLPAAASLAMLTCERGDSGARTRALLADGARLDMLLAGLLAASAPHFVQAPQACSARWQIRALRASLKMAACAANLVIAPSDTQSPEPSRADEPGVPAAAAAAADNKRRRLSESPVSRGGCGVTLFTAADVNVPRRDSTVLLVAGRPFHAFGMLLEKASGVLADALRDAPPTLGPVPVPLPVGVPESAHYALFTAAVEHAYTGDIGALDDASLLPLWCVGDHFGDGCAARVVRVASGARHGC
jgi:hypothetical protein